MPNNDRIFIQIAAYRDPELVPTIKDCLDKAKYPDRLRFGICWQHEVTDSWDSELLEFKNDPRFKIIDVRWNNSKGACWARNSIQEQLYDGEEYTLQLDSHHRFAQDWDETLIGWIKDLQAKGHKKPILTAYATPFNPEKHRGRQHDNLLEKDHALYLEFDRFTPEGCVFFKPHYIDGSNFWAGNGKGFHELTSAIPCRFFSAHFAFSIGDMVREVPHDPNYYFHGEEISIAMRSFTHGYDLFSPHRTVIWHEYTREYRIHKHWVDHVDANKNNLVDGINWYDRNNISHHRNRVLFDMESDPNIVFGKYGIGTVRTLADYEAYAKLDFKRRAEILPNGDGKFATLLTWNPEHFHQATDLDFVVCAIHNDAGDTLWREDFKPDTRRIMWDKSIQSNDELREGHSKLAVVFTAKMDSAPSKFVLWPHSKSKGWLHRIEKTINIGY
jgi:hypothetical protein